MKKFASILLVFLISFSFLTAFAKTPDYLEGFDSADFKITYEIKVNKISDFLFAELAKELGFEDKSALDNLNLSFTGKVEAYGDLPKAKMYVKAPKEELQKIIGALNPTAEAIGDYEVWIDLDFTDLQNMVYKVILKTPDEEKYIYLDFAQYLNVSQPGINIDFSKLEQAAKEKLEPIVEGYKKALENVKTIEEYNEKTGDYKFVIPASSIYEALNILVEYTFTNFDKIVGAYIDYMKEIDEEAANSLKEVLPSNLELLSYQAMAKMVVQTIKDMDIFADDALVISASQNKEKNEVYMKLALNIQTNLYDALGKSTLMSEQELKETFPIDGVNVKKEDFDIDLSVSINYEYSNLNAAKVDFPVLTEQNSIDYIKKIAEEQRLYEINQNFYINVNDKRVLFDTAPYIDNGTTFVPIRKLMNALGVADDKITYDNGVVQIYGDNLEITLLINSTKAYVNGQEVQLLSAPIIKDDRTYVPLRFISENLGFKVEFDSFGEGEYKFYFINIYSEDYYNEYYNFEYDDITDEVNDAA